MLSNKGASLLGCQSLHLRPSSESHLGKGGMQKGQLVKDHSQGPRNESGGNVQPQKSGGDHGISIDLIYDFTIDTTIDI